MTKRKKKNDTLNLGYYALAFIDLLGQQESLRNIHTLPNPNDHQEMETMKEHLRKTYGAVTRMRKFFNNAFEGYARKQRDLSGLTPAQNKEFKTFTNNPIKFQSFSDSMIIYMSLSTDTAKLPVRGIYGILGAVATTFMCCLAAGHPIRGGIDVGLGMDITKNEIYGPALSRAHTLESRIADYPRIVVGKDLIQYLKDLTGQAPGDVTTDMEKMMAEKCIKCLAIDVDGHPFIDYLGESYRLLFGETIDATVIKKAYDQVITCCIKFSKDKDSKLAFRYTILRNYFEARLPSWEELIAKSELKNNASSMKL